MFMNKTMNADGKRHKRSLAGKLVLTLVTGWKYEMIYSSCIGVWGESISCILQIPTKMGTSGQAGAWVSIRLGKLTYVVLNFSLSRPLLNSISSSQLFLVGRTIVLADGYVANLYVDYIFSLVSCMFIFN